MIGCGTMVQCKQSCWVNCVSWAKAAAERWKWLKLNMNEKWKLQATTIHSIRPNLIHSSRHQTAPWQDWSREIYQAPWNDVSSGCFQQPFIPPCIIHWSQSKGWDVRRQSFSSFLWLHLADYNRTTRLFVEMQCYILAARWK